jgi:hypothetical protein
MFSGFTLFHLKFSITFCILLKKFIYTVSSFCLHPLIYFIFKKLWLQFLFVFCVCSFTEQLKRERANCYFVKNKFLKWNCQWVSTEGSNKLLFQRATCWCRAFHSKNNCELVLKIYGWKILFLYIATNSICSEMRENFLH